MDVFSVMAEPCLTRIGVERSRDLVDQCEELAQVTSMQIVIAKSDGLSLLDAVRTAAAVCQEHGASLHDRAASIRAGWVHEGFKVGEMGAFAADRLGDAMDVKVGDYLRLAAIIEDAIVEDSTVLEREVSA
jgi:hypothetical protein